MNYLGRRILWQDFHIYLMVENVVAPDYDACSSAIPVVPGLYTGPWLYAKSPSWLSRHRITHIVNASVDCPCPHEKIVYLRVGIKDDSQSNIAAFFEQSNSFIFSALESGGSVLVHCVMGRSRSVTLTAGNTPMR